MTDHTAPKRVERTARLRWVPIAQMKTSPLAQRELNAARVDRLAADFDPEQIGVPTVSARDGWFFIIDGQHRIEALKAIGWGDQSVQCWTYEGMNEAEEAEMFLRLNDVLTVAGFAKYRVSLTAGREIECDIDRIVRAQQLVVSRDAIPGAIQAVGTLRRVYTRSNPKTLARTLRLIRDSYGDSGFEAPVIDGLALLCQRYNGQLNDQDAIERLGKVHGGVKGLLGAAEKIRRSTGNAKAHCVAAAAVEIINRGRGGKKLPSWWADQ